MWNMEVSLHSTAGGFGPSTMVVFKRLASPFLTNKTPTTTKLSHGCGAKWVSPSTPSCAFEVLDLVVPHQIFLTLTLLSLRVGSLLE